MGDYVVNFKGVRDGLADVMKNVFGIGATAPGFDRIFPVFKALSVLYSGAQSSIGPWNLATVRARQDCGGKAFSLTIDPSYAGVGLRIAVDFGSPSSTVILAPGETISVSQGFTEFYWSVANVAPSILNGASNSQFLLPRSGMAFLLGRTIGSRPFFDRSRGMRSAAAVQQSGLTGNSNGLYPSADPNTSGSQQMALICTDGAKGVTIRCVCVDVGGLPIAPPANLAATIQFWNLVQLVPATTLPSLSIDSPAGALQIYGQAGATQWSLSPGEEILNVSQGAMSFEREVVGGSVGSVLQIAGNPVATVWGTGVNNLYVEVEVY